MTTLLLKMHKFAAKRGLKIEIHIGETVVFDSLQTIEVRVSRGLHHIGMMFYTEELEQNLVSQDTVYEALERAADQLMNIV